MRGGGNLILFLHARNRISGKQRALHATDALPTDQTTFQNFLLSLGSVRLSKTVFEETCPEARVPMVLNEVRCHQVDQHLLLGLRYHVRLRAQKPRTDNGLIEVRFAAVRLSPPSVLECGLQ